MLETNLKGKCFFSRCYFISNQLILSLSNTHSFYNIDKNFSFLNEMSFHPKTEVLDLDKFSSTATHEYR